MAEINDGVELPDEYSTRRFVFMNPDVLYEEYNKMRGTEEPLSDGVLTALEQEAESSDVQDEWENKIAGNQPSEDEQRSLNSKIDGWMAKRE